MPTKNWEVIRTKVGTERVWTAYQKSFFSYHTDKEDVKLAFVGVSTEGSYFLALKVLAKRYNIPVDDGSLFAVARRYSSRGPSLHHLYSREDEGNSGAKMVVAELPSYLDRESVIAMVRGEK